MGRIILKLWTAGNAPNDRTINNYSKVVGVRIIDKFYSVNKSFDGHNSLLSDLTFVP